MKQIHKYLCLAALLCNACRPEPTPLENALRLAGGNRPELEKVLRHYSQSPADSLRLQAARFLITHMPGHYTLAGPLIDAYHAKVDADTSATYFCRKLFHITLSQSEYLRQQSQRREDIRHITADFLIRHIDLSFRQLDTYPWLRDIPFPLFLEHLLPYRFAHEPLDLWKEHLPLDPQALRQVIQSHYRTKYTIDLTNRVILEENPKISAPLMQAIFGKDLLKECLYLVSQNLLLSQAYGHPSAIDFFPHYANRNGFHYWNVTLSPEFTYRLPILYSFERKTAKVWRKTYSRNPLPVPAPGEYIPPFFTDPFHKDVSHEYLHTATVSLPVTADTRHAYLCVFNNLDWQPVAAAPVQNGEARFDGMGKGILYLPVCYPDARQQPAGYPFILDLQGRIHPLIPDTLHPQTLRLTRKYPTHHLLDIYKKHLQHLRLLASDTPTAHTGDTIPAIFTSNHPHYLPAPNQPKRYWHFTTSQKLNIAEIYFITPQGDLPEGKTAARHRPASDNNPLTNLTLRPGETLTIDFGAPIEIAKIICLPQNDGNGIYPGNTYELLYHSRHGWQSLGQQTPQDCHLEYAGVPGNALLWLRNHTTGQEERIFTAQNGQIRFW